MAENVVMKNYTPQNRTKSQEENAFWARVFIDLFENPRDTVDDIAQRHDIPLDVLLTKAKLEGWPDRADPDMPPHQIPRHLARNLTDACRIMSEAQAKETIDDIIGLSLPGNKTKKAAFPDTDSLPVLLPDDKKAVARAKRKVQLATEKTLRDAEDPLNEGVDFSGKLPPDLSLSPDSGNMVHGSGDTAPGAEDGKAPLPAEAAETLALVSALLSRSGSPAHFTAKGEAAVAVPGPDLASEHRREVYEAVAEKIKTAARTLPAPKTWRDMQIAVELARQALGLNDRVNGGGGPMTVQVNVLTNRRDNIERAAAMPDVTVVSRTPPVARTITVPAGDVKKDAKAIASAKKARRKFKDVT